MKTKKNDKTKSNKPFAEYSAFPPFYKLPYHKESRKAVFHLLKSAANSFVFIQQKQKYGITHIPVVHVDHHLDQQIPFTPSKVKIYLDFVWFFCRIITMLLKKLGNASAIPLCAGFVHFIAGLYEKAGSVYSTTLTTTDRPKYYGSPRFILIHAADPHLLCVPSLHVAIVAGTYAFIRQELKNSSFSEGEKEAILAEIYEGAVRITESVLYVKQHSINCVAGAMYLLTAGHEDGFFTEEDSGKFLDKLFEDADDIFPQDVIDIRNYMKEMYSNLIEENKKSQLWQQPLFNWLNNYKN